MSTQPSSATTPRALNCRCPSCCGRPAPTPTQRDGDRGPHGQEGAPSSPPWGVSPAAPRPLVIDTDVYGAQLVPAQPSRRSNEPIIIGRPAFISFQTAAEPPLRCAPTQLGETGRESSKPAPPRRDGPHGARAGARLCAPQGPVRAHRHASASVSTTPTAGSRQPRYGLCPAVSNDGIFRNGPGLVLESAANPWR